MQGDMIHVKIPVTPRWLKFLGLVFLALALIQGLRISNWMVDPIRVEYIAPHGELSVSVRDAENQELRRSFFVRGERAHELKVPPGAYRVILKPADEAPRLVVLDVLRDKRRYSVDWSQGAALSP